MLLCLGTIFETMDLDGKIKMHFEEFIIEAIKTESKVCPINGHTFSSRQRMIHAYLGMLTETGELLDGVKKYTYYGTPVDRINVKEEIGDLFWYVALAVDVIGVIPRPKKYMGVRKIENIGGEIANLAGFYLSIQNSSEETAIKPINALSIILGLMDALCLLYGFNKSDIYILVIKKLTTRYPDKFFDAEKANNRDLPTERRTLEADKHSHHNCNTHGCRKK